MQRRGHPCVMPSRSDRRARFATTAVFFTTGFVFAAWATRVPAIKAELGLSSGELGLAILGLEAGAIAGLPAGAALTARLGAAARCASATPATQPRWWPWRSRPA
jgi:hypothetical protein